MRFEYRLQLKDFEEANQVHSRKTLRFYYLLILAIAIGISLISLLQSGNISGEEILAQVILPNLIFIIIFIAMINITRYFFIKRAWESQPNLSHEITAEVVEDGLQITTPLAESRIKWAIFTHWRETPNLFMVYQSKNCFNLFPKRAFNNEEEVAAFRELLNTQVQSNSQLANQSR